MNKKIIYLSILIVLFAVTLSNKNQDSALSHKDTKEVSLLQQKKEEIAQKADREVSSVVETYQKPKNPIKENINSMTIARADFFERSNSPVKETISHEYACPVISNPSWEKDISTDPYEEELPVFVKVETGLQYSRLDGVDKNNQTSAYLLSNPNLKYSASLYFPLNKHNFLIAKGEMQKVSFEDTISNRSVEGMNQNLTSFSLGYAYEKDLVFRSFLNYEQRMYFMVDNANLNLRAFSMPTLNFDLGYHFQLNKKVGLMPSIGYKHIFSQDTPNLSLLGGQELSLSLSPTLKIKEHLLGIDFYYKTSKEESNLVKQDYKQIGGTMWLKISF